MAPRKRSTCKRMIFTSYSSLETYLQELPKCKEGLIRVYRGQTHEYDRILATGLRKPVPRGWIWQHCVLQIARSFLSSLPEEERHRLRQTDSESVLHLLHMWAIWAKSIVQHYGPGSEFLDVTYSPEVALWFALHVAEKGLLAGIVAMPMEPYEASTKGAAIGTVNVLAGLGPMLRYEAWTEEYTRYREARNDEIGFLYVFDVPPWTGGVLAHGALVDLAAIPRVFGDSRRLQVQKACLLATNPSCDGGNLKPFCVCDPIPVQWPMTGTSGLDAATDEMFPRPDEDPWYARLLSIPLVHEVDKSTSSLRLARPLPVTIYLPDDSQKHKDRFPKPTILSPEFVLPRLLHSGHNPINRPGDQALRLEPATFHLKDATPILLELPLLAMHGDTMMNYLAMRWGAKADNSLLGQDKTDVRERFCNYGVLSGDMSDSVDVSDARTGETLPMTLKSVFLEFSPLEAIGSTYGLTRGLWLIRDEMFFILRVIQQSFDPEVFWGETLVYRFDTKKRRLVRWYEKSQKWFEVFVFQAPAFPDYHLFLALSILRELSPGPKADPEAIYGEPTQDGGFQTVLKVRDRAAKLVRLSEPRGEVLWHVLRDVASNEPFSGPSNSRYLTIESQVPWAQVEAAAIRHHVEENFEQATDVPPGGLPKA